MQLNNFPFDYPANSSRKANSEKLWNSWVWGFWTRWTLGTFLGFLMSLLFIEVGERPELGVIEGTIGGAVVGLIQAWLLSPQLRKAWLWGIVNLLGWGFLASSRFGVIGWYAPATDLLSVRLMYGTMFGAVAGLWLGALQWLILRDQIVSAWQWIVISALSWSAGLSIGWALGGNLHAMTHLFLGEVVGLAVTWLLVGAITGVMLVRLLQKRG